MQSYLKYKGYYENKETTPLKVNDNSYVLNPKADNQSMKFAFKDCIWTGPYVIVKALSNNNYVVRRTGTRYTQTLHRIRLRLYAPNQQVPDVTVRGDDYLPDPEVKTTRNDWYGEVLFGTLTEKTEDDAVTTENGVVKTTTVEKSEVDKTSFDIVTSFNLDVSDNLLHYVAAAYRKFSQNAKISAYSCKM